LSGVQASSDQSVNYTNVIIGVVVGILIFILIIVFYVWYNLKNRTEGLEKEGLKNE
jgi:predicted RND superfamily exporter protein